MEGITITPLKIIEGKDGNVMHALKAVEKSYEKFGEAYFSTVNHNAIKGWKKHTEMISNLIVPVGEIKFIFFDDRKGSKTEGEFFEINLSSKNYYRITAEPNLWMAFKGIGKNLNLLLNISSIGHNPEESISLSLDEFKYKF